jgi:hypothetical protein
MRKLFSVAGAAAPAVSNHQKIAALQALVDDRRCGLDPRRVVMGKDYGHLSGDASDDTIGT